jgi:small redox-active disulfide protein 2
MTMEIKVLGSGCPNCRRLYEEAEKAVRQLGMTATITKVEKFEQIAAYKIMARPALVINGQVKAAGRIPGVAEIITWLATAAMEEQ